MLKIDSNMTIKMSRGQDAKFPLFLNQGNSIEQIRYTMRGDTVNIIRTSLNNLKIDSKKWQGYLFKEYLFTYKNNNWYCDNQIVDIDKLGITFTGAPEEDDIIEVDYVEGDGCEIYFKIYQINSLCPFYSKTFTSNDQWLGKWDEGTPVGDIKIELLHTDPLLIPETTLDEVEPGEYRYQITGKLLDPTVSQKRGEYVYINEVLTNKLKLYIIDDDYEARLWSDVRKR